MKTIQIISGGMDSAILLHYQKAKEYEIKALSFNYGQKHNKELKYARHQCDYLGIEHQVIDLENIKTLLGSESVLINKDINVPHGHYEEPKMKATIVPNRNMMMIAMATAWAISSKYECVSYGAHAGDSAIYPDCREEFIEALSNAMQLCDWHKVWLNRPFINKTKADIVQIGVDLKVDFTDTWTCYKGEDVHCGMCATCIERREAFYLAGVEDPTEYSKNALGIDELVNNDWRL